MKSLDGPHLLTSSEKIWTWIARIMSLPLTEPLQHLTKDLLAPVVTGPSHAGVRDLAAVIWFFGPVVLNSLLWAAVIWWASARIKRRFGRVLPGE
jgi:hypothetical protein